MGQGYYGELFKSTIVEVRVRYLGIDEFHWNLPFKVSGGSEE